MALRSSAREMDANLAGDARFVVPDGDGALVRFAIRAASLTALSKKIRRLVSSTNGALVSARTLNSASSKRNARFRALV